MYVFQEKGNMNCEQVGEAKERVGLSWRSKMGWRETEIDEGGSNEEG